MPHIAGAGVCCLDHIVIALRAAWGDSARISRYFAQGGGLVATALVACTRPGAKCDLFSPMERGQVSNQIVDELRNERILTQRGDRDRGRTESAEPHTRR